MLLRTAEVPDKFTKRDMLNYAQRLQNFLQQMVANDLIDLAQHFDA